MMTIKTHLDSELKKNRYVLLVYFPPFFCQTFISKFETRPKTLILFEEHFKNGVFFPHHIFSSSVLLGIYTYAS